MSHVSIIPADQAQGELKELYGTVRELFGFVPNLVLAQGSRPDLLRIWMGQNEILDRGVLPRELKEKIGIVVSAANSNSYCIIAHLEILHRLGVDRALGKQLSVDYTRAEVSAEEMALFRFADKLTRSPFDIKKADIEDLRRHGWQDEAIVESVHVTAHYNYVNRLSAGLGVIPEDVF